MPGTKKDPLKPERPSFLFGRRKKDATADLLVPATPAEVWGLITDAERVQLWWPRAVSGAVINGEGIGREQLVRLSWGGREGRVTQRVVAWEPHAKYGWNIVQEAVDQSVLPPIASTTVTISIAPERALARVRIAGRFEPIGPRGAIALRQLVRSARTTYRRALANLEAGLRGPV